MTTDAMIIIIITNDTLNDIKKGRRCNKSYILIQTANNPTNEKLKISKYQIIGDFVFQSLQIQ